MPATDWGTKSDHLRSIEISPSRNAAITKRWANILGPKAAWSPFVRHCTWEVRWSARCHQQRGVKNSQLTQVRLFRHPLQIASLHSQHLFDIFTRARRQPASSRLKLGQAGKSSSRQQHTQETCVLFCEAALLLWMFTKQRRRLFYHCARTSSASCLTLLNWAKL